MNDRTYSEREVAAIIERAAESQRAAPPRGDAPGLTLAEIERAGQEAGLDPALLRSAAAELDAGALTLGPGRSKSAVAERWIDIPLQPEAWEDAVSALRLQFGASATAGWGGSDTAQVGMGQEWTHQNLSGVRTTISASPRGDRTRIRVVQADRGFENERLQGVIMGAGLAFLPALVSGALVAEALGRGDLWGIVTMIVVLVLGSGIGVTTLATRTRRRRERQAAQVQHLADDVAQRLSPGADPAVLADNAPASARLDDAWMDADEAAAPEGAPPRRRTHS